MTNTDYVTELLETYPAIVAVVKRSRMETEDFKKFHATVMAARQLTTTIRSARRGAWWWFASTHDARRRDGAVVVDYLRTRLAEFPEVSVEAAWYDRGTHSAPDGSTQTAETPSGVPQGGNGASTLISEIAAAFDEYGVCDSCEHPECPPMKQQILRGLV